MALLALTGVNGIWVFLSGSRGSSFVALCCALYVVKQQGVSLQSLGVAAAVLACGIVVSGQFLSKGTFATDKVLKLFESDRSLTNRTSGRSDLALGGWYIFLDHPLGIGTGGFAPAWARLGARRGLSGFHMDTEFPAHSAWIKVLAENGLPGILLLTAFVGSFAVVGLQARNSKAAAIGILTTFTLALAFISTEFQPKGLWLFAAGSTFLLSRAPRRSRVRKEHRADRGLAARDSAA
jgi:O-antigen ligase